MSWWKMENLITADSRFDIGYWKLTYAHGIVNDEGNSGVHLLYWIKKDNDGKGSVDRKF